MKQKTYIKLFTLICIFLSFFLLSGCFEDEPAERMMLTDYFSDAGENETEEVPEEPTGVPTVEPTEAPTEISTEAPSREPTSVPTAAPAEEPQERHFTGESYFEVHYIDVGQGDAVLVKCDDEYMMIDGGNKSQSSLIFSYLKKENVSNLKYIIATHDDEDHTGGLSGALNYATVLNALAPIKSSNSESFNDFIKYLAKQNVSVQIPPFGTEFTLGSAKCVILGPVNQYNDDNNMSLVIKIFYGETSFLFTGDMETKAEADLIGSGYDLSCNVLKVAHHGSAYSSSASFIEKVHPMYSVVSVGKNNSYGHPTDQTLNVLESAGSAVYRTDLNGEIIFRSDGRNVTVTCEKYDEPERVIPVEQPTDSREIVENVTYIGNKNTHKFHKTTCKTLPKEENRVYFSSYQEAIDAGYVECKNCFK